MQNGALDPIQPRGLLRPQRPKLADTGHWVSSENVPLTEERDVRSNHFDD